MLDLLWLNMWKFGRLLVCIVVLKVGMFCRVMWWLKLSDWICFGFLS